MKKCVVALAALLLAGCSTHPISPDKATPVPHVRLKGFQPSGESELVVTRDSGAFGSGVNYDLFIDGVPAAEFAAGEVAIFGLSAGRHVLGVRPSTFFGGAMRESEIELKPSETQRRRISLDAGGYYLTPTAY